jgi:hypothetical protein
VLDGDGRLGRAPAGSESVVLLGATGLTERRTAFSAPELAMAWAEEHTQGASVEPIRRLCARFVQLDEVEPVGDEPSPGRPQRYSTAELTQLERHALALVERGIDADAPSVPPEVIERTLRDRDAAFPLSPEQEAMLRATVATGDRVVCVVGLAGAGKTTATHALAEAFGAAGVRVLGAAPSGVAAEQLQDETGIRSTTLHRLLAEARDEGGLPAGCVVVLDEAGMAETRLLAPLLDSVDTAGGKLVLLGDPHQLPAVGAGGLFAAIVERQGAIELKENRRQRDELERDALAAIRCGFGRDYLAFAEKSERLVVSDSPLATRALARRLVEPCSRRPEGKRDDRPATPRRRRAERARANAPGNERPTRAQPPRYRRARVRARRPRRLPTQQRRDRCQERDARNDRTSRPRRAFPRDPH